MVLSSVAVEPTRTLLGEVHVFFVHAIRPSLGKFRVVAGFWMRFDYDHNLTCSRVEREKNTQVTTNHSRRPTCVSFFSECFIQYMRISWQGSRHEEVAAYESCNRVETSFSYIALLRIYHRHDRWFGTYDTTSSSQVPFSSTQSMHDSSAT